MRGTQHNRYPKVLYSTEQRCRSTMQEYRRIEQTCLFIHYPVSDRHTIICVSELVILFLITLANKGKKHCLFNDRIVEAKRSFAEAARFRAILHTLVYMYGPFHSLIIILIIPMDDY